MSDPDLIGKGRLIPGSQEPIRIRCEGCGQEMHCFHIFTEKGKILDGCAVCLRDGRIVANMVGVIALTAKAVSFTLPLIRCLAAHRRVRSIRQCNRYPSPA